MFHGICQKNAQWETFCANIVSRQIYKRMMWMMLLYLYHHLSGIRPCDLLWFHVISSVVSPNLPSPLDLVLWSVLLEKMEFLWFGPVTQIKWIVTFTSFHFRRKL